MGAYGQNVLTIGGRALKRSLMNTGYGQFQQSPLAGKSYRKSHKTVSTENPQWACPESLQVSAGQF